MEPRMKKWQDLYHLNWRSIDIWKIDVIVTNLNSTNMFLEYNWLVKHNPEANWNKGTI